MNAASFLSLLQELGAIHLIRDGHFLDVNVIRDQNIF